MGQGGPAVRTKFYFVRHAQPDIRHREDASRPLSAKGRQDCGLVARYLLDKDIDVVLSSPFQRAVHTLLPFARQRGLPIERVDGFRERAVGAWVDDFDAFARQQWANFDYRLPGGESLREVQGRGLAALSCARQTHRGKNIAVGSHGTALSTLLHHFDPSFGYEGFARIQPLMPWIAVLTFEDDACEQIETVNLFAPDA